jgi:hypothetical protein
MLSSLVWVSILLFMIFRWRILVPFIGPVKMLAADALIDTVWAAYCLGNPGPYKWFNYGVGIAFLVFAFSSGRKYLAVSEKLGKTTDDQSNSGSNSPPTAGV